MANTRPPPPEMPPPELAPPEMAPMELALHEARAAAELDEVPVGAALVDSASGELLARAHNRVEALHDPTAHAELLAIAAAARRLGLQRLTGAHPYGTLPPFAMSPPAAAWARPSRCIRGSPRSISTNLPAPPATRVPGPVMSLSACASRG